MVLAHRSLIYFLSHSQVPSAQQPLCSLESSSLKKFRTKWRISSPVFGVNAKAKTEPIAIPPRSEAIHNVVFFIRVVFLVVNNSLLHPLNKQITRHKLHYSTKNRCVQTTFWTHPYCMNLYYKSYSTTLPSECMFYRSCRLREPHPNEHPL